MTFKTVKVAYPYRLTCVPKGCQNERTILAAGETVAAIAVLDPEEGTPAYRLRFPADDPNRYVWARHKSGDAWLLRPAEVELIRHDGAIWWPWCLPRRKSRYDMGSIDALVARLGDHRHDILGLTPGDIVHRVVARPPTRSVSLDDIDNTEAIAQRKMCENFLIRRDQVFVRGGEPIYVKNHHGRVRSWEIQIASAGPDRSADPRRLGIDKPPGDQNDRRVWIALASGAFWIADMTASAREAAHRMQCEIPSIECLDAKHDPDLTANLTIDAILRRTIDMAGREWILRDDVNEIFLRSLNAELAGDVTRMRVLALRSYLQRNFHWHREYCELRTLLDRFEAAHPLPTLSAEDDEALASFC